ncbi:hypothetical protein [Azotosporobacter soli]|uniref:hypothetical protein n=1 Tax=Azotosporobacter soli TaxID=3055040 RepID=UPI0031FEA919
MTMDAFFCGHSIHRCAPIRLRRRWMRLVSSAPWMATAIDEKIATAKSAQLSNCYITLKFDLPKLTMFKILLSFWQ